MPADELRKCMVRVIEVFDEEFSLELAEMVFVIEGIKASLFGAFLAHTMPINPDRNAGFSGTNDETCRKANDG